MWTSSSVNILEIDGLDSCSTSQSHCVSIAVDGQERLVGKLVVLFFS